MLIKTDWIEHVPTLSCLFLFFQARKVSRVIRVTWAPRAARCGGGTERRTSASNGYTSHGAFTDIRMWRVKRASTVIHQSHCKYLQTSDLAWKPWWTSDNIWRCHFFILSVSDWIYFCFVLNWPMIVLVFPVYLYRRAFYYCFIKLYVTVFKRWNRQ